MKKYIMFSSVSAEKYFIICISCPILQNRFLYDSSGSILRMQKAPSCTAGKDLLPVSQ